MHFPLSFSLAGFQLPAHLLFETLAYTLGFQLYRWQQRQRTEASPLTRHQQLALLLAGLLGAIAGAQLLGWLQTPFLLGSEGQRLWLPPSKTIVGGLLGGWAGIEVAKALLRFRPKTGDLYVWPLTLGLGLGRLGCFFSGLQDNTYGLPTRLPWGVDFGDGLLRHPTQLYEILFVLVLAVGVTFWPGLQQLAAGSRFRLWMAGYLGFRFLSEGLKPVMYLYGGLSAIQWACLLGFSWCLYELWRLQRPMKQTLTPAMDKKPVAETLFTEG